MSSLARDLRFALRVLRKSPGFTAVAIFSIALGIGPNTAVFSIVNGVLLRDEGVSEPDRVVQIFWGSYSAMSYSTLEAIRDGTGDVFQGITAFTNFNGRLGTEGDRTVLGELVLGNYFQVLGVEPVVGRGFLPEEDRTPGTHPVTVLSHRLWQTELGGDPGVVGSDIRLNGRPYTVVGIAPPGFEGRALPPDLWVPLRMYPHLNPGQMGSGNLWTLGRVRDGVPLERAVSAVAALADRMDQRLQANPETNRRFRLEAVPIEDFYLAPDLDGPILAMAGLLLGAVGLVLLIACTNLAGFHLARATDRRREMAVRAAMGADRRTVLRQLLVESLLLATVGGLLGLGLGLAVVEGVEGMEPPIGAPLNLDLGLDGRVLLFTVAATLVAGLVFGLGPALRASRAPVASMLRDESTGAGESRGKMGARNLLVSGQVALSLVLLVAAGLLLRSFRAATTMDPGFDTGPAGIVGVNAAASGYEPEEVPGLLEELERRAEAAPGVETAGLTTRLPLELGVHVFFLDIPGVPPPSGDHHRMEIAAVSGDYFEAMDIGLQEGREFTPDDGPGAPRVAILSRAAAQRYWPGESALDRVMLRAGNPELQYRVVGIAEDVKIWNLQEPPRPYMYLPLSQQPSSYVDIVGRGARPPGEIAAALRDAVKAVDPDLFVPTVKTMDEHLGFILYLPRMGALLLVGFGALALLLASLGLWGLVSYAVARRTREVGIRISLGARKGDVLALAMKGGMRLVVVGGVVGLAAALAGTRFLEGFLIGVEGLDPLSFVVAVLTLGAVALVAAYLPARRAVQVDPVKALRTE